MAEAALATMPDVFKPHIEGVVISIEEFADDETLASLDIEHPYDLTGLYEGRTLTERSIGESGGMRSEEHTSELQSLMRISYAVFCSKKKTTTTHNRPLHINIKNTTNLTLL